MLWTPCTNVKPRYEHKPRIIRGHPLAQKLVGCWLFNEGAGPNVFDLSGYGHHGTFQNAATWAQTSKGPAYSAGLNNTDYLLIPDAPLLDGTPELTILVWAKNNKATIAATGADGLVYKSGAGNDSYAISWSQSEALTATVSVGSTTYGIGVYTVNPWNIWRQAGLRYDGVNVTGIVDGALLTSTNTACTGNVNATAHPLLIGGDNGNISWDGQIALVCIWARALTAGEIAAISFAGNPFQFIEAARPVTYSFGEESGTGASGTLSQTLGALTATATGAVTVKGAVSQTLGALTVSSTGKVQVSGVTSVTLGSLTSTATGKVIVQGAVSVTLGDLTVTATGTNQTTSSGSVSQTLGALTVQATGKVTVSGQASVTLGALTVSSAATVRVAGQLSNTLGSLTLNAQGKVEVHGVLAVTLGQLVMSNQSVFIHPDSAIHPFNRSFILDGNVRSSQGRRSFTPQSTSSQGRRSF